MSTVYSEQFYDVIAAYGHESAQALLPVVFEMVRPTSVIDFGCGPGSWLAECRRLGAGRVLGVDGDFVPREKLEIRGDEFLAVDLSRPAEPPEACRGFDLAMCLEVAEHLPHRAARPLVKALTTAAPVVLFSAAVPGQLGTHHINEQWPRYWERLFRERGFVKLDPFRKLVWQDGRIAWYYRQNVLLYVSENDPRLDGEAAWRERGRPMDLELIHPGILHEYGSFRAIFGQTAAAFVRAVKRIVFR